MECVNDFWSFRKERENSVHLYTQSLNENYSELRQLHLSRTTLKTVFDLTLLVH